MATETLELVSNGTLAIEKKYGLIYKEFSRDHLFANHPVVMLDYCHSALVPRRFLESAETLGIFFGSPGGEFPYVHYNYMGLHANKTQLYGIKEFTVIPPDQTPHIYPKWQTYI